MPAPGKYRIGIVGSEAAKFTKETEAIARGLIRQLVQRASLIVSGGCHLGGVDIWAVDEAVAAGVPFIEYLPRVLSWNGYRERNLQIVAGSEEVVCITVSRLPDGYNGLRFDLCYHCSTNTHVKSGGCWTVKQAIRAGKVGKVLVV